MLKTLSIAAAALVGLAATMSAQVIDPPDTFKVNYYSNANYSGDPDGTVRITNVGTEIGSTAANSGNLCAMVYVLSPDQQLAECCGCRLTPDGLLTLSINNDLTSNPLTPVTLHTGDIKIVSSFGYSTGCNPSKPVPTAGIRAWATHIQNASGSFLAVTETEFSDSTLSAGELAQLVGKCKAILNNGSGFGVCSCGVGD
jgi:hypothetical protein